MADVSTITANGITYNIKDSTARTDIGDLETDISGLESELLTKQNKIISKTLSISGSTTQQTIGTISGDSDIKSSMVVIGSIVGDQHCQTSDWTVTTSDGGLTVYGSALAATTVTLILAET